MVARLPLACSAVLLLLLSAGCAVERGSAASGGAQGAAGTAAQLAGTGGSSNPGAALKSIPCTARNVVLSPGKDNGDFNGMSHSGTYLTLTNKSRNACSIPGVPQLTFLDANGPVTTTADLPGARFMHPGPAVPPIVLQPKQSVTTGARWVSGPVFQDNLCYKLTGVTLGLASDGGSMTPLVGTMCGERSKGVHYDLKRYAENNAAPNTGTK